MLRAFGPNCDGHPIDPAGQKIPEDATWIDLENPTREEEALVERCLELDIPTRSDLEEIEPSSRLYEQDGAIYMTVSTLTGVTEGSPTTEPIAFVLTADRIVTLRYAAPKSFAQFHRPRRSRSGAGARRADGLAANARCDRRPPRGRARASRERSIEGLSGQIFEANLEARRIPAAKLTVAPDPDRRDPESAHQNPLFGGQHGPPAELPRRRRTGCRPSAPAGRSTLAASPPTSTR